MVPLTLTLVYKEAKWINTTNYEELSELKALEMNTTAEKITMSQPKEPKAKLEVSKKHLVLGCPLLTII